MKTIRFLSLWVASIVFVGCAFADSWPNVPHVTAYGTAITEVAPDELRWSVTVENQGADVAQVAEWHSKLVASTLGFLRTSGVPEKHVQTAHMQLAEHREYINNSWVKQGYRAQTQIAFRTQNIAGYRDLWLGLARLEGVAIGGVRWDFSERPRVQQSTRAEALQAARSKAAEMVAVLNGRLAEPLMIEEISEGEMNEMHFNRLAMQETAGGGEAPVAAGLIPIRVRVKVAFRVVAN